MQATYVFSHTPHTFHRADERTHVQFTRYLVSPVVLPQTYAHLTCPQNHSCDPNCYINACYINEANLDKPLLTIFTQRDVLPGEELCFSYLGNDDDDDAEEDSVRCALVSLAALSVLTFISGGRAAKQRCGVRQVSVRRGELQGAHVQVMRTVWTLAFSWSGFFIGS